MAKYTSANTSIEDCLSILDSITTDIYQELGAGHLECIYHNALYQSLFAHFQPQVFQSKPMIPVYYHKGLVGHVIPDFIITTHQGPVVIELKAGQRKSTDNFLKTYKNQLAKYENTCKSVCEILVYFGSDKAVIEVASKSDLTNGLMSHINQPQPTIAQYLINSLTDPSKDDIQSKDSEGIFVESVFAVDLE